MSSLDVAAALIVALLRRLRFVTGKVGVSSTSVQVRSVESVSPKGVGSYAGIWVTAA